jgi:hypothetical protein
MLNITQIPYFTPVQLIQSGIAIVHHDNVVLPKLFQPIKLRGLTLQNRIIVSPMCQYSADKGIENSLLVELPVDLWKCPIREF